MIDPEALCARLIKEVMLGFGPRIRFAVTAEEYEALWEWLLKVDGRFYGRLRGIPLVIEKDPIKPPILAVSRETGEIK